MSSPDTRIDELYQGGLAAFVGARTALAKTLKGDDARRVKSLAKPTAVAWAVNQVYWHARDVYKRLVESGKKVRTAQLAALRGRSADVRGASDAHRKVLRDAVAAAGRFASAAGLHPNAEALTRMFEALSLSGQAPAHPGRFTERLQPAGFEALEGVTVKPVAATHEVKPFSTASRQPPPAGRTLRFPNDVQRRDRERTKAERERAKAEREKASRIKRGESAVTRAKTVEAQALESWHRAKERVDAAERALASLRGDT